MGRTSLQDRGGEHAGAGLAFVGGVYGALTIKRHEARAKVEDICRELSISAGTFYNWSSKYAGLEVNEAKRLRDLEAENSKLKRRLADNLLKSGAVKHVLS